MRLGLVLCALVALPMSALAQHAAEIVSIAGKGEYSTLGPSTGMRPASPQQKLPADSYVRTLKDSKMALLFVDKTAVTLDANAVMQVKLRAPDRGLADFQRGSGRFETKTIPTKGFEVRTPAGNATIRGTEWVVDVADDGKSAFTVVEGEIDIANEMGSLSVGANEEGILEKGKAPYKRRLQNARERVQWVSHFSVDPAAYAELREGGAMTGRYATVLAALKDNDIARAQDLLAADAARDGAPVAYFLLADIALYRGKPGEAADWLRKAQSRFPQEPRTAGLLARAHLIADDMPAAREAARRALSTHPDALESQLFAGEVARLDGDRRAATAALRRATQIAPNDWRAWHALGQLHSERSDPRRARTALGRADQLSPRNATVLGERGLVEANAYDLPLARSILDSAVAAQPEDFLAWTGVGLARIKSGDLEGALDALRRATVIEPRYARAHIYLAVVYWQQGRASDALAELRTASVHDPRDPLPYQYAAMIHSDQLRPGEAMAAAREAMARLRYVKSLDEIANNLKGSANLGTPLAQLGLESWALKNAQDSFDPLWAGSHLFLADRLNGKFVANSELMQGFLSDPLAFGTSNRYQPLIAGPGLYGTLAWRGAQNPDFKLSEPLANVNGLTAEGRLAYFLEGSVLDVWPRDASSKDRASSVTGALGVRLRDDFGAFVYNNRLVVHSTVGYPGRSAFDAYQRIFGPANRNDVGFVYRPGPDTQVWAKMGHGSEDSRLVSREVVSVGTVRAFRDSDFSTEPRRNDWQARATHRFANGFEASLTGERATYRTLDFLERDAFVRLTETGARSLESVAQDIRDTSRDAELAVRFPASWAFVAEVQADYSRYEKTNDILVRRDFINQRVSLEDDHDRKGWNSRFGFVWKAPHGVTLRGAYQRWLRPASIGSLRTPSTAGIVLDQRYVLPGGQFERWRWQGEWEATPRLLVTGFVDRQKIDNLYSSLIGVLNNRPDSSNLERLRNRSFNALASLDALEGFPDLSRGRLDEEGLTANLVVGKHVSLFAEGTRADGVNTGSQRGKMLAFLPKTRYAVGATCFSDRHWLIAAKAVRRGERFSDEANTVRLPAEWSGAVQAYWETADKRFSVELIVSNIGARSADDSVGVALTYRF